MADRTFVKTDTRAPVTTDDRAAIGLYLHVPFCVKKCPYCDFYSLAADEETMDAYTDALCAAMERQSDRLPAADTLYFGGGTPSLLGARRIERLIAVARRRFGLQNAEITMEVNPAERLDELFSAFASQGGNRVSIGVQATTDAALRRLGRRHTVRDAEKAIEAAHRAGVHNLSVDLLLGTENQTDADVRAAAAQCAAWDVTHVSAYLLKIEEGTPFGRTPPPLPDEDATAALYLTAVEALEAHGFAQYEISNFARRGYASRHNLKYWNGEPYIGLGPSAHSFYEGRRWYYPRDLAAFMRGEPPLREQTEEDPLLPENGAEEYAMLRLRLTEGLRQDAFAARFGRDLPTEWRRRAEALPSRLIRVDAEGMALTAEGFLLSNRILRAVLLNEK